MITTEAAEAIRQLAVGRLERAVRLTLATVAAVPEDKFDFKPSETANSVRELIRHLCGGNGYVSQAFGLPAPVVPSGDSREELVAAFSAGANAIVESAKVMPAERFNESVDFFGGQIPMAAFLLTQEWHVSRHAAQIDYLETIWGDLEDHG